MFSFSLSERVILSAGAMLIFSVDLLAIRTDDLWGFRGKAETNLYRYKLTKCPKAIDYHQTVLIYLRGWG